MMWSASVCRYHNNVQKRPPMTWFENGFIGEMGLVQNHTESTVTVIYSLGKITNQKGLE